MAKKYAWAETYIEIYKMMKKAEAELSYRDYLSLLRALHGDISSEISNKDTKRY